MKKWTKIKLYKQGKEYNIDLPLDDTAIILVDTWELIILEDHREKINLLLDKFRGFKIPIIHANYGNKSGLVINKTDIVLHEPYCTVKNMPKYLFYAGYEIDKCILGRSISIPYATYENKMPILIKDLTDSISEYDDISPELMKQAAINIIEHCYGFTTTFDDLMTSLNHTLITTAKRNIIEPVKILIR